MARRSSTSATNRKQGEGRIRLRIRPPEFHIEPLVNGVVAGIQKRTKRVRGIEIAVTPVAPLSPAQRKRVREEADRIAVFLDAPFELAA